MRYLERIVTIPLTYVRTDPNYVAASPPGPGEIDKHVFAKHKGLQLRATSGAVDSVFLRRAYLDLIGALPTPEEAVRFLDSTETG